MKKIKLLLLVCVAGAISLTSCSQDPVLEPETVQAEGRADEFRTYATFYFNGQQLYPSAIGDQQFLYLIIGSQYNGTLSIVPNPVMIGHPYRWTVNVIPPSNFNSIYGDYITKPTNNIGPGDLSFRLRASFYVTFEIEGHTHIFNFV